MEILSFHVNAKYIDLFGVLRSSSIVSICRVEKKKKPEGTIYSLIQSGTAGRFGREPG